MNRRNRSIAALVFALCPASAPRFASASCIALSKQSGVVDCRAVIAPPFMAGTLYVLAALFADDAVAGITGAEFRIEGFPASWFTSAVLNPAWTATGDPLGTGCSVAMPSCQGGPGSSNLVLLYTLTYFPTDMAVHIVNVVTSSPPADPLFDCPVVKMCNGDRYCVTGGYFWFNDFGPCEVGLQPATWSQVKALYMDATR